MKQIEFIQQQMQEVDQWTLGLLSGLKAEHWDPIPEVNTSIHWQLGHIAVSKYFHVIDSTIDAKEGIKENIAQEIELENLLQYYFAGSDPMQFWDNRPHANDMLELFQWISSLSLEVVQNISDDELKQETCIANPVAKTKGEALSFSFKHQMWHNGQIAFLKRFLNQ